MYKKNTGGVPSASTGRPSSTRTPRASYGDRSASSSRPSYGASSSYASSSSRPAYGRSARPLYDAPASAPRSSSAPSYGARSASSYSAGGRPAYRGGGSASNYAPRSNSSYSTRGPGATFGSRPSFAGNRFGGSSRFGGRSGGFSGGRGGSRGGSRGGFAQKSFMNLSKFINKAVVTEEVVEQFVPEHKFTDFTFDERLKNNILGRGYTDPTPIQDKSIPHIMKGEDVCGIANTGTGKTAAFVLPLINRALANPKEQILIVVPTRELAIQIEDEIKKFITGLKIYSVSCVGGASIRKQISELKYVNNFIIGTPGRLKDLIERKYINLSYVKTVVLDEADRMLDMGFVNDMKYMMDKMPKDRQTLFFSATLSSEIEALIGQFLRNPVRISVKTRDTSKTIDQDVVRVPAGGDKVEVLHDLLNKEDFSRVIIFGKTKHGVERLSNALVQRGFKADSIHGDKNFVGRQRSLGSFKKGDIQILVATDVAARGLDIPDVSHVINFDLPATYEDYIHRIGRTGRGGKTGKALTFVQ